MRPARAAPGVPFVNLPLRPSPNACAGDCRGIFDPVVPYKPPRLTAHLTCSNLALAVVNMTLIATARFSRPVTCAQQTPHRPAMPHVNSFKRKTVSFCSAMPYSAATLISLSRRRRFRPAVWPAGTARVFGTVCPVYLRPDNRPRSWTAVGVTRFYRVFRLCRHRYPMRGH
jgi:hypothetical protein